MSRILCTGCAGFIGSHLVDSLIKDGHDVTVIDNLSTGNINNIDKKASVIIRDVRDDLSDIFKEKFDYVYHLAAQINLRSSILNPTYDASVNICGSLNIIEHCIKNKIKLIFFSTGTVYHEMAELPWYELTTTQPHSPYAMSKFTVENYLEMLSNINKLDYVILRCGNVYGPRQNPKGEAGVIAIFMDNIINNKQITIFGDGNQTRDFVYVEDVVKAARLAHKLKGIYNVSTGIGTSVNEIYHMIKEVTRKDLDVKYGNKISGEIEHIEISSRKLQAEGWTPNVNIKTGIELTWKSFSC